MLLVADKLTKAYGPTVALDALDLSVAPGEVVGLLGPNGSGKTTSLRLFLGFLKATSGTAILGGFDCWAQSVQARKLVTYLPGELRLYDTMTGRQLVKFLGDLRGETFGREVDDLAKRLDIDPDTPLTRMSSGMKRKVALLAVLLPKVPLIILDEPTNTLDPTMRDEFLEQIKLAKAAGKAILFSSHVLSEVEAVCDRVVILRKGKLVHHQVMSELTEFRKVSVRVKGTPPTTGPDGEAVRPDGDRVRFDYAGELPKLMAWLAAYELHDVTIEPQGLGAIYRRYHAGG
ncbi:MAG: ABC transporter ATP-binding protein [Fimbriiglobus sp.]|jgi:ABC-2 type transport system ATP-binding protein|nr:ABC transporter ATP-binding protein [Fimbriiglobus sp.]